VGTPRSTRVDDDHHLTWLRDAGLAPVVLERLAELDATLWARSFDPRLMELIRLRFAQLLGADGELERRTPQAVAAGIDDATVAELAQWPTSPRFDDRDRLALGWAEQWLVDVTGVTDDDAAALQAAFSERELAQLTMAVAVFEMTTRACVALTAAPVAG
jgi:alkylhydroperoxidase family enzyme